MARSSGRVHKPTTHRLGRPPQKPTAIKVFDAIEVGGAPGSPSGKTKPTAGETVRVQADPRLEYVAGGTGGSMAWYANYIRSLPWAIDDITGDFGDDLYDRMLLDPEVAANVNALKAAILEDGVTLTSAIEEEDDPDYEQAQTICDVATDMLSKLTPALDVVLWDMLAAVALGNTVAEQVYVIDDVYTGTPQLVLKALKVKPRRATAYVVDVFDNLVGLMAFIPGMGLSVQQGTIINANANDINLLPREKFALLTFRPKQSNPRGSSILRAAYEPWYQKQQVNREYLKYLSRFASPSLVGHVAPDTLETSVLDPQGVPTGATISPETALLTSLLTFQNGTAMAVPPGADVRPIQVTGEGMAFINALERYDKQIAKAILSQTLATGEADHQTGAATNVHQDVLQTMIRQAKKAVCMMLHMDVLRPWVRYNYGDDAASTLTPQVTLGTVEESDVAPLMLGVAALMTAGYFASSQLSDIDTLLGLPEREPGEPTIVEEAAAAAREAQAAAAKNALDLAKARGPLAPSPALPGALPGEASAPPEASTTHQDAPPGTGTGPGGVGPTGAERTGGMAPTRTGAAGGQGTPGNPTGVQDSASGAQQAAKSGPGKSTSRTAPAKRGKSGRKGAAKMSRWRPDDMFPAAQQSPFAASAASLTHIISIAARPDPAPPPRQQEVWELILAAGKNGQHSNGTAPEGRRSS